jgi:hypothetical protein
LTEKREEARTKTATYKETTTTIYYNKTVKPQSFTLGTWVLRKVALATKDPTEDKMRPAWEGPYRIIKSDMKEAYHLETIEGKKLLRPWNTEHLLKYYM